MTELIYSDWGLANRFGNTIVLNKNLKKYPELHDSLLKHEIKHNEKIIFNLQHDLESIKEAGTLEWISKTIFMIQHPKSLIQLSPIIIHKKRPYFDLSLILLYSLIYIIFFL